MGIAGSCHSLHAAGSVSHVRAFWHGQAGFSGNPERGVLYKESRWQSFWTPINFERTNTHMQIASTNRYDPETSDRTGYGPDYGRDYRTDEPNRQFGPSSRQRESWRDGSDFDRNERDRNEYGHDLARARYEREFGRGMRGRDEDRGYYGRDTAPPGYDIDDRGFMDRAGDEVRSWFGNDEAERRRRYDEMNAGGDRSSPLGSRGYREGVDYSRAYGDTSYGRNMGRSNPDRDEQDQETASGAYGGLMPKNYNRSPERTVEEVCEVMTWSDRLDPSGIEISADEGEVTLEGTVGSRREKRLAESLAESVRGVRDVHNRLRIQRSSDADAKSGSSAARTSSKKKTDRTSTMPDSSAVGSN